MVNERKRISKAFGLSILIHTVLIAIFFFIVVWRPLDPPPPKIGMSIDLGITATPKGGASSKAAPAETQQIEQAVEESEPTANEVAQDVLNPVTQQQENAVKASSQEETTTPTNQQTVEQKAVEKPTPVENKVVEELTPIEKPVPVKKSTPVVDESTLFSDDPLDGKKEEGKAVDESTLFKGSGKGSEAESGDGKHDGGNNGASLDLSGWSWTKPPRTDTSSETGRILFLIKVDEFGDVISAVPIEKTVSSRLVQFYTKSVMELKFVPKGGGDRPPVTIGKITFILKAD